MARRSDLESICLIGSGPIVIGQACEFDYAGCQALKVLRADGFRTIVVNSNPATIMTDPGFADRTYIEPLDLDSGHGGGFVWTQEELRRQVEICLHESPISQVLVEESVRGWDEFELEVVRDRVDNVVIVCSIENLDPMGVHTGDSVTVAPQMTLSDLAYQELRDAAAAVIRRVGVDTGGSK